MDALLLAAFAKPPKNARVLDLGCGCGVVGFGMLLKNPDLKLCGVDIEPELIRCASENAEKLGLIGHYRALELNLCKIYKSEIKPESFDTVVSNPPFRRKDQGRLPGTEMRESALFESNASLNDFISAVAFALKNKGEFYCIFSAERLVELTCLLQKHRLEPKHLLPLQALQHKECGLILIKAVKNGRPGLKLETPILVYEPPDQAGHPSLSEEILKFCPWLACNSRRPG